MKQEAAWLGDRLADPEAAESTGEQGNDQRGDEAEDEPAGHRKPDPGTSACLQRRKPGAAGGSRRCDDDDRLGDKVHQRPADELEISPTNGQQFCRKTPGRSGFQDRRGSRLAGTVSTASAISTGAARPSEKIRMLKIITS